MEQCKNMEHWRGPIVPFEVTKGVRAADCRSSGTECKKPMSRQISGLGSVLIVEDDVFQSDLLSSTLLDGGASEVRCCATATEALAELTGYSPGVIILDVRLADGDDGWQMAELAQQIFTRMPLVVFATGSPERIPAKIAEMGILAVKPYDAVELVEIIRSRVRRTTRSRFMGFIDRR
jgi:CheY-like chemotaxis protein